MAFDAFDLGVNGAAMDESGGLPPFCGVMDGERGGDENGFDGEDGRCCSIVGEWHRGICDVVGEAGYKPQAVVVGEWLLSLSLSLSLLLSLSLSLLLALSILL